MEALRILESASDINWDYDEEADVLYLSIGEPRPALGVDIGEGVVLRFDERRREVVGITMMGLRHRLVDSLASATPSQE